MNEVETHSLTADTAPAVDRPYFVVRGQATSEIVELPAVASLRIGRAGDSGIVLDDMTVSSRHALLTISDGEVSIQDEGSRHGVRVNGDRIEGPRLLKTGDTVELGKAQLQFWARRRCLARRAYAWDEFLLLSLRVLKPAPASRGAVGVLLLSGASGQLIARLTPQLRTVDIVGARDPSEVILLIPELNPPAIRRTAAALTKDTADEECERTGLAIAPEDGGDLETLLALADARSREPARRDAGDESTELEIGDRKILIADPAMLRVYDKLRLLAAGEISVLIHGETGAGKENAARALHAWSSRAPGPFCAINCAAIPDNLVESILFGYERGAFSGADTAKAGYLEVANGGTLFLDEIAELSLEAQAALLRAIDNKSVLRLGATKERTINVRIVAATHRNLAEDIQTKAFRADLYYRIAATVVELPPLRERPGEIGLLAKRFLSQYWKRKEPLPELARSTLTILSRYSWPGNVRELKNMMECLALTLDPNAAIVDPHHLDPRLLAAAAGSRAASGARPSQAFQPLSDEIRELEVRRMLEALDAAGGVQTRAAELLKMPMRTFAEKHKVYALAKLREQRGS